MTTALKIGTKVNIPIKNRSNNSMPSHSAGRVADQVGDMST